MKKYLLISCLVLYTSISSFAGPVEILCELWSLQKIASSSQAIIILGSGENSSSAWVVLCEKTGTTWITLPEKFPAVVGKNGFASVGAKREGDGMSPTGVFTLSMAFGYAPSCDTRMPYRQATINDYWVDDQESPLYNTWVHGKHGAKSAEKLRRNDILYKWGVVVDYNTSPVVKGKGSAIFLHIWRKPGSFTAGCAAFAEKDMIRLLKWLDPEKKPVVIMGLPDEIKKFTKG